MNLETVLYYFLVISVWFFSIYAIFYSKVFKDISAENYFKEKRKFWYITRLPHILLIIFIICDSFLVKHYFEFFLRFEIKPIDYFVLISILSLFICLIPIIITLVTVSKMIPKFNEYDEIFKDKKEN